MATQRMPILGFNTTPDTSGEVYPNLYSTIDSGAVIDPLVLVFAAATKNGVRGSFRVPEIYVDSAVLKIVCTANATAGTIVFDWSVLTRSGTEDMGAAATRTTETGNVTKGGTAFTREEVSITLTDTDYVAGDEALFELFMDGVTATIAAPVAVFGVYFQYADA
jgi:hypothetical protein